MVKKIWRRLLHRYRISVIDHDSLLQKRVFLASPMAGLVLLGFLVVVLVGGTIAGLVFTPLREWIPGYTNPRLVTEVDTLRKRVETLNNQVGQYEAFLNSISEVAGNPRPENGSQPQSASPAQGAQPESHATQPEAHAATPEPVISGGANRYALLARMLFEPPARGVLRNKFGLDKHPGIDIMTSPGETVRAAAAGYVVFAGYTAKEGFVVTVDHGNGVISIYKNLGRIFIRSGEKLKQGEAMGESGITSEFSSGPSLHFELWAQGMAMDPERYVNLN